MTDTKFCPSCHTEKPFSEFHRRSKGKDGLQSQCIECKTKRQRAVRAEKRLESSARKRVSHPKKHVCTPACTARFGFCVTLRNIQRRKDFAKYGSPIFCKSGRVAKQASFARAK